MVRDAFLVVCLAALFDEKSLRSPPSRRSLPPTRRSVCERLPWPRGSDLRFSNRLRGFDLLNLVYMEHSVKAVLPIISHT